MLLREIRRGKMAKRNDDCNVARPRMLYGEDSPTVETTDRASTREQQVAQGSGDNGPAQGTARLVRSYSRRFQRPSQTKLLTGILPLHEYVSDDAIPPCVQLSGSVVGGYSDGSVRGSQLASSVVGGYSDGSVRGSQLASSVVGGYSDGSVRGSQLACSVADRKCNESVVDRDVDDIAVHRQINESVDTKVDESVIHRTFNEGVADRKFDESIVGGKYDEGVVNRTFDESVGDRQVHNSVIGRKAFSRVMGRELSGSVVDRHLDSSLVKRKPDESDIGRKSAASVWGRTMLASAVDRKLTASIIGRNSKYSVKLTPVGHRITSRRIKTGSRNQSNKSRRSRLDDLSRSASYYHRDIVDEHLLISAAKLDSTLIRLFSHARENNGEARGQQDPGAALMPFLNYSQSDLISMDAVMWRVFPMDAAQRETLDQELAYIEENLTPNDITRHLYDKSILTHMDYNQLTRTEGQGEKAVTRLMVKTLQRRGDQAYPAFLEALQAHRYEHICARLAETERCLRDAMAAESSDSGDRSKIDHACMHQYQSGATSKLRTLRAVETNGNSSPPTFISSANQVSTFGNDTGLTNHTHALEHTPVGGIYHVKEEAAVDQTPATSDFHVVNSKKLEKQLLELMAEFESLQREVIAMKKSSPSPQVGRGVDASFSLVKMTERMITYSSLLSGLQEVMALSHHRPIAGSVEETSSNSDEVESEHPESHFATHEVSSLNIESIATNHPVCYKDLTPQPSPRKGAQKSIHCIIL